jgi:zinc transporter
VTATAHGDSRAEVYGLLLAYGLDGHGGGRALSAAEIAKWRSEEGVLWLHLDFSQEDTADFLHGLPDLPPVVAEALCLDETRPRVDIIGDGLLIILRAVNTNPGAEPDDMVSIRLWLEPHRIITSRRRQLKSILDVQHSLDKGNGPLNPGSFLLQLIDRIGYRTSLTIGELEDAIDALEEQFNTERQSIPQLRMQLSNQRRQCAILRRHIAPQRDALERLSRETATLLSDNLRLQLREEADKFRRYVEDLDLARERAMVAHEHMQAIIAEEQNQRMFLLSIVAAIFLPLSFVTGLLGMNVGGIPGSNYPLAFTFLLLGMSAVAVVLFLFFRRRRWI